MSPKFTELIIMENNKAASPFCYIFGHNYVYLSNIDEHTSELVCKCCKSLFISDTNGNMHLSENQTLRNNYTAYLDAKQNGGLKLTPIALPAKLK